MWVIIGIIIAIVFLLHETAKNREENERRGIVFRDISAKYIGGFSDVKGGEKADIGIKKNEIEIIIGGSVFNSNKIIPIDMITNAEIKSESQITREVGLGKMIVFGALAFAMKTDKSTVKNYIVISCDDNGSKRDLIFESMIPEMVVRKIRRIKGIESIF
jgi:hypothetical protein